VFSLDPSFDEQLAKSVREQLRGRTALVEKKMFELQKASGVPALAEPWFLTFNAAVEFHAVMSPQELQESGLGKLGEKWG
jgi:hypothetical protein